MELISQLKAILKPELLLGLNTSDSFFLEEIQEKKEDTRVELFGISPPFLAVRVDKIQHLAALRPVKDKWLQTCDYLLIGQSGDSNYAILIELKDVLGDKNRYKGKEQLVRSLPILEYLLSVCASEYGSSEKSNLTIRCVLIAEKEHSKLVKRGSQGSKPGQWGQETHKSIQITIFAAPALHFAALASD